MTGPATNGYPNNSGYNKTNPFTKTSNSKIMVPYALKQQAKAFIRFFHKVSLYSPAKQAECNICGWGGRAFLDNTYHKGVVCPNCGTTFAHRLLWATIQAKRIDLSNKKVLHFACEGSIRKHISKMTNEYYTADFLAPGYDYGKLTYPRLDISNMLQIESNAFDVVIAMDVLEHVYNDTKAFEEVYRVLKKGGIFLFSIPQLDTGKKTIENLNDLSDEKRTELIGQKDHWRIYGMDISEKIKNPGFSLEIVTPDKFDSTTVKKNVLQPQLFASHPLATNIRRIYICTKN
jgi:SAM-dependent methyltransferase